MFLIKRDEKGSPIALILKTVTSIFFMLTALIALSQNEDAQKYSYFIIAGLLFGLIGDIALDLKFVYPQDDALYTYSGMTSFSLGHVFYLTALIFYFGFNVWALVAAVVIAAAVLCVTKFAMKFDYGKYIWITAIYSLLLMYFMCQSVYTVITSFSLSTLYLAIGGVMFALSDAVLSMEYFGGKNSKALIAVNHITYYLAQYAIALSILYFAV